MATEAQKAANRRNAQKSTGPRSAEGKAAVARNAVRHGLFAQRVELPGEDADLRQAFFDAVIAELQPVGMNQRLLAQRIAEIQWKLQRIPIIEEHVMRSESIDVLRDECLDEAPYLAPTAAGIIASNFDLFLRYQLYEQRLERSWRSYMDRLAKMKEAAPADDDDEAAAAMARYLELREKVDLKKQSQFSDKSLEEDELRPDDDAAGTDAPAENRETETGAASQPDIPRVEAAGAGQIADAGEDRPAVAEDGQPHAGGVGQVAADQERGALDGADGGQPPGQGGEVNAGVADGADLHRVAPAEGGEAGLDGTGQEVELAPAARRAIEKAEAFKAREAELKRIRRESRQMWGRSIRNQFERDLRLGSRDRCRDGAEYSDGFTRR